MVTWGWGETNKTKQKTRLREGQWGYKKKPIVQIIYKEPLITGDQLHTVTDGPPQTTSASILSRTHRAAL